MQTLHMYMTVLSVIRQGLDQLESPATSVLHWHPNPVSDIIFSHDGKMIWLVFFCLLACVIYVYLIVSGSYKSLSTDLKKLLFKQYWKLSKYEIRNTKYEIRNTKYESYRIPPKHIFKKKTQALLFAALGSLDSYADTSTLISEIKKAS